MKGVSSSSRRAEVKIQEKEETIKELRKENRKIQSRNKEIKKSRDEWRSKYLAEKEKRKREEKRQSVKIISKSNVRPCCIEGHKYDELMVHLCVHIYVLG